MGTCWHIEGWILSKQERMQGAQEDRPHFVYRLPRMTCKPSPRQEASHYSTPMPKLVTPRHRQLLVDKNMVQCLVGNQTQTWSSVQCLVAPVATQTLELWIFGL